MEVLKSRTSERCSLKERNSLLFKIHVSWVPKKYAVHPPITQRRTDLMNKLWAYVKLQNCEEKWCKKS